MPELPEMENYNVLLSERILHKPIDAVRIHRQKSINISAQDFTKELIGQSVRLIERRAKFLIFHLSSDKFLLLHLMLDGWMHLGTEADKPDRSTQVEIDVGGETLYFIGLRLGYIHLLDEDQVVDRMKELGPEPLDEAFTFEKFLQSANHKKGVLKTLLLSQYWIAGIGNCYSDEICFDAQIKPMHKISEIPDSRLAQIFNSIQTVLRDAVSRGGYMENPLYAGDQLTGGYNDYCRVYDRGSEPCVRCGSPIQKIKLVSRKCFYCESCQH
jgi:formamidopyrimidine-DNA glycosylase